MGILGQITDRKMDLVEMQEIYLKEIREIEKEAKKRRRP